MVGWQVTGDDHVGFAVLCLILVGDAVGFPKAVGYRVTSSVGLNVFTVNPVGDTVGADVVVSDATDSKLSTFPESDKSEECSILTFLT